MDERWYKRAVIYSVEVDAFQDSNGDGIGDLRGLISRLDHIARLGATCLWLNPVHPSPGRDEGYDVSDFYGVHPQLGTVGDFVDLVDAAGDRGMRVLLDLVVNHTSIEHPWFQSARADPRSPYRDWYVWSDHEPSDRRQGMVFPGVQTETWTFDEKASAWYFHRFYDFEPDLNHANPAVRDEIRKIMAFWMRLGVAGFRMDAAPFVIELPRPDHPEVVRDYEFLNEIRNWLSWRRGDAVILAEANVPDDQLALYTGRTAGSDDRLQMLFNFRLNARMALALARRRAEPINWALRTSPELPGSAQWATFIRNHDEEDLSQLSEGERDEVFAAFAPDEDMRLYGRGIRRRLAPMLGGDRRRLELAYSIQFTLPGTPVVRYGEEIGMGDDLSLPERNSIRTPMQWSGGRTAGFSTAEPDRLVRPIVTDSSFAPEKVNVGLQRDDPQSLLTWFERVLRCLRECPEIGENSCEVLDSGQPSVLAHRFAGPSGAMLFLHNLDEVPCTVQLSGQLDHDGAPVESFANRDYGVLDPNLAQLALDGYGYRWIRLRFTP
ncbi:MAG: alpha-amylase family protein [Candidatus Dormibacteraeota bacterium]|nr:alpha-amylase family protein [Candidatus Dormibacteraeota bacterium]